LYDKDKRHAEAELDMRCEDIDFAAYLTGELDLAGQKAVRAHLQTCEHCREQLAGETSFNRAMRQGLQISVAPAYWNRIWPRVQVQLVQRRQRRFRLWLRWAFAGAGAFAVAVFFVFILSAVLPGPMLAMHESSYFTNLPAAPPVVIEENTRQSTSLEIASLAMGSPTPSERAEIWRRVTDLEEDTR